MDISQLLPLMHQYKARKVKMGSLEVELDASAFAAAPVAEKAPEAPAVPSMPENFLFWSVPDQTPLVQFDRADASKPATEETPS